jgi:hypothetical protein
MVIGIYDKKKAEYIKTHAVIESCPAQTDESQTILNLNIEKATADYEALLHSEKSNQRDA